MLSYDGYALYNWKRFDLAGPIALGNIDTIQNFVHLYDEHWFILVHVEIEAVAAEILAGIGRAAEAMRHTDDQQLNESLARIAQAVWRQVGVCAASPRKWTPRCTTRPSGPTSVSSRMSCTKASRKRP